MPRRIVYGVSLWAFLAAAACTIAAIVLPNWVSYTAPTDNDPIHVNYGLHRRCSSVTGQCTPFPQDEDCLGNDRYFCSMWRSTGFFMNLSVIMEIVVLVAYLVILLGGRVSREAGWKILSALLALVAAGQLIAMALVVSRLIGNKEDEEDLGSKRNADEKWHRLIYMTTTLGFFLVGSSTSRGFFARSAGRGCSSTRLALSLLHFSFREKTTTSRFRNSGDLARAVSYS